MTKKNVLNIQFDSYTKNELINILSDRITNNRKTFLVTANPEIVMYARADSSYKHIISKADFMIADGFGVVLGSKILGDPVPERVAGFDLMCELLALGNEKGWSAYFLGAKPEVIAKAVANIKVTYPKLQIAGYHDGYFKDSTDIRDEIATLKPDLVFVALGFPKQEKWIDESMPQFEKGLFIGVGGSFDVLAGAVKRAPLIWQKLNLEWFYRLIQEPSRWRRMLVLPKFLIEVFLVKLTIKRD